VICEICKRKPDKLYKHHIVPKVKGGAKKGIVYCCRTCSKQIHMLFSVNELAKMTLDEILNTHEMQKYIKWIQRRRGDYKVRLSNRLRRK
jgi:hypothetical protein